MAAMTVWVRQEGETPGAPIYATETVARRLTAGDYSDAFDLDDDETEALRWETCGDRVELWNGDDPTDWFLTASTVIEEG